MPTILKPPMYSKYAPMQHHLKSFKTRSLRALGCVVSIGWAITIAVPSFAEGNAIDNSRWDGDNIILHYKNSPIYPEASVAAVRGFETRCNQLGIRPKSTPKTDAEIVESLTHYTTVYLSDSKKTVVTDQGGGPATRLKEETCNFQLTAKSDRILTTDIFLDTRRTTTVTTMGKTRTETITRGQPFVQMAEGMRARRKKEVVYALNDKGDHSRDGELKNINGYDCRVSVWVKDICTFARQPLHYPTNTNIRVSVRSLDTPPIKERCGAFEKNPGSTKAVDNFASLITCMAPHEDVLQSLQYDARMPSGIFEMPASAMQGEIVRLSH
jgi:hypothetical protein